MHTHHRRPARNLYTQHHHLAMVILGCAILLALLALIMALPPRARAAAHSQRGHSDRVLTIAAAPSRIAAAPWLSGRR